MTHHAKPTRPTASRRGEAHVGTVLGVLLGALVAGLVPAAGDLAASVGDMLSVILGSLIDFLRLLVDPNTWSNVFGLWPRG